MPPPELNERFNLVADWTEFYGDIREEVPPDAPEPLGEFVKISGYVDSNHAGNVVTRRSHTGIFIFLNNALITAFSKRQNTVEGSTFGSELVAMQVMRDLVKALRIKLMWFGVPIHGPADVFADNEAV